MSRRDLILASMTLTGQATEFNPLVLPGSHNFFDWVSHKHTLEHTHTHKHNQNVAFGRTRLDTRLLSHIPSSPWSLSQPTVCTPGDELLHWRRRSSGPYRRHLPWITVPARRLLIASLIRDSAPNPPIVQPERRPKGGRAGGRRGDDQTRGRWRKAERRDAGDEQRVLITASFNYEHRQNNEVSYMNNNSDALVFPDIDCAAVCFRIITFNI